MGWLTQPLTTQGYQLNLGCRWLNLTIEHESYKYSHETTNSLNLNLAAIKSFYYVLKMPTNLILTTRNSTAHQTISLLNEHRVIWYICGKRGMKRVMWYLSFKWIRKPVAWSHHMMISGWCLKFTNSHTKKDQQNFIVKYQMLCKSMGNKFFFPTNTLFTPISYIKRL